MAEVSLISGTLHVGTISKNDHWVDDMLPRFVAHLRAACSGDVRLHLLLLEDPAVPGKAAARRAAYARTLFDDVIFEAFHDPWPRHRLLTFDSLRARLTTTFGVEELLYIDPDTDVVADLQGVQHVATESDVLWVSNPMPLQPVIADLRRHGFLTAEEETTPECVEPGCLFLRRDMSAAFAAIMAEYPDVHAFAPGSTYWNMLVRRLGCRATRLPDSFNRTFWDVSASAATARTVHFTGQWKRLLPYVSYDRPRRRIVIHDRPVPLPSPNTSSDRKPSALNVIMLVRDSAAWLPSAFERFVDWERSGLPLRYHVFENDSTDATAALVADFMHKRRGRLESGRLTIPTHKAPGGTNYDRIMPLAHMRNHITDIAMTAAPLAADEWTLLLDSDIYFPADVLERVFNAQSHDPDPESIGMLTVYTQQLFDPTRFPGITTPAPNIPDFAIADHYYDTYAFQDGTHKTSHPLCSFERCRRCVAFRPAGAPEDLIPRSRPIVDVAAAFGGFALIRSCVLRDPRIRWSTYSFGFDRLRVLSEHVIFCDRLRSVTGKRVVILQDVDHVYRR